MFRKAFDGEPGEPETKRANKSRELDIYSLSEEQQELFTAKGGSDDKDWDAWQGLGAVEILDEKQSREVENRKDAQVVPLRWVRTNKNEALEKADFLAKSRMVAIGIRDKCLGYYRRDAPTISKLAECLILVILCAIGFISVCCDIKKAYFQGRDF